MAATVLDKLLHLSIAQGNCAGYYGRGGVLAAHNSWCGGFEHRHGDRPMHSLHGADLRATWRYATYIFFPIFAIESVFWFPTMISNPHQVLRGADFALLDLLGCRGEMEHRWKSLSPRLALRSRSLEPRRRRRIAPEGVVGSFPGRATYRKEYTWRGAARAREHHGGRHRTAAQIYDRGAASHVAFDRAPPSQSLSGARLWGRWLTSW